MNLCRSQETHSEAIVSDLVTSFLIPYVEKQLVREKCMSLPNPSME
jgi:hypothetical protein